MAFTPGVVTWDNVYQVSEPLSLQVCKLEDVRFGVNKLGLGDWRAGILGWRKSTKAEERGSDLGDQDFSSQYIRGYCFPVRLFCHSYCYKEGNGYRVFFSKVTFHCSRIGKALWLLDSRTRTWRLPPSPLLSKTESWITVLRFMNSGWSVCLEPSMSPDLYLARLVKCLDETVCFSFSFWLVLF